VKSTDIALEVGPGTGNLTAKLVEAAKKVREHTFALQFHFNHSASNIDLSLGYCSGIGSSYGCRNTKEISGNVCTSNNSYPKFIHREHFNRIQIIYGDVIKIDLPYFDICVANIPYQVSLLSIHSY
jgi:18S rRNA (adenine1779-N6/adenine1780-N6)-dimethyltransferase